MEIKENFFESERHKSFYLSCGPEDGELIIMTHGWPCLLYTSPSPRDLGKSRMPSSA